MNASAFEQAQKGLWLFGAISVILYVAGPVLLPFIVGTFIAWSLQPVMSGAARYKVPRWITATLLMTALAIAALAVFAFVLPAIAHVFELALQAAKSAYPDFMATLEYVTGMSIEQPAREAIEQVNEGELETLIEPAKLATPFFLSVMGSVLNGLLLTFITPVVTFYLLVDWQTINRTVRRWLPHDTASELENLWALSVDRALSYVWGRAIVIFWMALLHIAGLWVIGLDHSIVVGTVAGISVLVPMIGNLFALLLALCVALLQSPDTTLLIGIVAVFGLGQLIEMMIIEPYFLGNSMDLHPFLVLLVLLVGGHLLGVLGAIIALPVAAIIIGILESAQATSIQEADAPA